MKACVFQSPNEPLEVVELPDPAASPGEVVVRVKDCGICGSDLHAARQNAGMPAGTIMGHEFSAVVDHVGAGVSGLLPGDPVVVMSYLPCGECAACRAGDAVQCTAMRVVGFGEVPGAYAEKMKTRPGACFKMPPGLSHRAAATVEPLVVGLHGVRRAGLMAGETCLIMGAGPIGLVTLLWAKFAGARAVVVSEIAPTRAKVAKKMGADFVVDPRIQNPNQPLVKMTGRGADVVFECIGAPGTFAEAVNYAQRGGRVVVIGVCMAEDGFPPLMALSKELDVRFSLGLRPGEIETAIEMLAAGRVDTAPMITHTLGIEDFPRAFSALSRPTDQTKVMLEF